MKSGKWLVILGIILFGNQTFAADSAVIKVGLAFRFEEAAQERFINSFTQGLDLAKKQFMKAHPEYRIEFVKYPHQRTPDSITAVAKKIVKDDIRYVIGGESSDEVKAMVDVFESSKVILMSPTSSDPRTTQGKNFIYRACFSDDQTARTLARFVMNELRAREKPGHTTVLGIVHNTGNNYTDFLTRTFTEEFNKLNRPTGKQVIKVVKREYSGEHFNFSEMVKGLAAEGVSALTLFTGKDDFLHFVDSAQKQKLNPIYYGSDGWGTNQSVIENLGKQGLLSEFTGVLNSYWYEESERPEVKKFISEYKSSYSRAPDGWSAISYDAAKVLLEAVQKATVNLVANTTDVAKVLKTTEFTGLITTPKLKYENGNSPKKTLYLYEISANRANFKAALE